MTEAEEAVNAVERIHRHVLDGYVKALRFIESDPGVIAEKKAAARNNYDKSVEVLAAYVEVAKEFAAKTYPPQAVIGAGAVFFGEADKFLKAAQAKRELSDMLADLRAKA